MEWIWKKLARHVGRMKTVIEFEGLSEEGLAAALHQESVRRLKHIEAIVFSDEIEEGKKLNALKEWFLAEDC